MNWIVFQLHYTSSYPTASSPFIVPCFPASSLLPMSFSFITVPHVLQLHHCSPSLSLHLLPFPERVQFKLCTLVYKCLHQLAPVSLSELFVPVSTHPGRSHLCSAAIGDLLVPPTRTKTIGLSLNYFKERLKTFFLCEVAENFRDGSAIRK